VAVRGGGVTRPMPVAWGRYDVCAMSEDLTGEHHELYAPGIAGIARPYEGLSCVRD
jgi:hypothetical protein